MTVKLREMMISVDDFETRVAVLEDRKLVEIYTERVVSPSIVGNVYLGRVKDVLPGMDAAFVDIGLDKNAFLFIEEVTFPQEDLASAPRKIQHLLKPGQEIMVQVIKEPMGAKGARVTTEIALPGRYLVLLPFGDSIGVSRRLESEERDRLRRLCEGILPKETGLIVRTVARGAELGQLKKDLRYLLRVWRGLNRRAKVVKPPQVLYEELQLPLKIVRDVFSADFKRLVIDSSIKHQRTLFFLSRTAPELKNRVELYKEKLPLFDRYGIEEEIRNALKSKVWLRSGGYIVIGHTEALTSIDVNTGKYVGKTGLQETILKTNLEAAEEIARQIRLRDIGGIIVIDFIDMANPRNRREVYRVLSEALSADRVKTHVAEISRLGLVEMTRKNVSEGLIEFLCEPCSCCRGTGVVLSREAAAIESVRKMHRACLSNVSEALLFKVSPQVADFLAKEGKTALQRLRVCTKKRIYFYGDPESPLDACELIGEGAYREVEKEYKALIEGERFVDR
ncbi:MAG TPA: ribonuclease E/G [Actinobacteria bacterium]|nr:ribonuclease E/G [Actinomycetota bacterium]